MPSFADALDDEAGIPDATAALLAVPVRSSCSCSQCQFVPFTATSALHAAATTATLLPQLPLLLLLLLMCFEREAAAQSGLASLCCGSSRAPPARTTTPAPT